MLQTPDLYREGCKNMKRILQVGAMERVLHAWDGEGLMKIMLFAWCPSLRESPVTFMQWIHTEWPVWTRCCYVHNSQGPCSQEAQGWERETHNKHQTQICHLDNLRERGHDKNPWGPYVRDEEAVLRGVVQAENWKKWVASDGVIWGRAMSSRRKWAFSSFEAATCVACPTNSKNASTMDGSFGQNGKRWVGEVGRNSLLGSTWPCIKKQDGGGGGNGAHICWVFITGQAFSQVHSHKWWGLELTPGSLSPNPQILYVLY